MSRQAMAQISSGRLEPPQSPYGPLSRLRARTPGFLCSSCRRDSPTGRSAGKAISATKLRPGEIVIEGDGRPLDDARTGELRLELSGADSVELTLQRNGRIRKRVIDLRR